MRYLGLDLGTKTLGMATSDRLGMIASPFKVLNYDNYLNSLDELVSIIETEKIEAIVLGLPLNMNGSEGPRVIETKEFKNILEKEISVPIYFQDERLTTTEAEKVLIAADVSRKKRKKIIDKMAAVIILQSYLNKEKR